MNNFCPYCKTELINVRHLSHARKCNHRPSDNISDIKYDILVSKFQIDTEHLVYDYTCNFYSLPDIKVKYGIHYDVTRFILSYNNIPIRTLKQAGELPSRKVKYINTNIDRYGVINPSQLPEIKLKKETTCLRNYGVTNIRKSKYLYNHITDICINRYGMKRITDANKISESRKSFTRQKWEDIYAKYQQTCKIRYGKFNPIFTGGESKLEKRVQRILVDRNIRYINQFPYKKKIFDIFLPEYRYVIEINGDFWHANPRIYNSDDILNFPGKVKPLAKEIWKKDFLKNISLAELNFRCMVLWECEMNQLSDNELYLKILYEISEN